MRPKLAAIGTSVLLLTTCSVPAIGSYPEQPKLKPIRIQVEEKNISILNYGISQTILEKQAEQKLAAIAAQQEYERMINQNTTDLEHAVFKALRRVGETPYVFSGSTPNGWDCSGLVMWVYGSIGIELEHSATKQMIAGYIVDIPKFGDLVVFKRNGSKRAYHVGIYIEEGKMLHAGGKKGDITEVISISSFADTNSKILYSRLIKTN